jgi:hypothetical protein
MFSEIESFFNLIGKAFRLFSKKPKQPESVATRFVRLFELHGVHRNQIPRFFGHGITVADIKDDDTLLPKLTEEILDAAVELFAVRREWLDGTETKIYPLHDFYKKPEAFGPFLDEIKSKNPDDQLNGVVYAPKEKSLNGEALIILEEFIGSIGNKPISRFHLCNNWYFDYWKSRAYLTACIAIAWRKDVYLRGDIAPAKEIAKFAYGEAFLELDEFGSLRLGRGKWYPEDMLLDPEAYLDGIDPELDNFGIRAGLAHWLELDKEGYMKIDLSASQDARNRFQQVLDNCR